MPLERLIRKIPKKAQLKRMNRVERADAERTLAASIGVHHQGGIAPGENFRSTRLTQRESTLVGLKRPTDDVMRANDRDVQPGSLVIHSKSSIAAVSHMDARMLEKTILAHAEKMGERSFETVARQILPQLNALGALGKQGRRVKAVQAALAKRAFGSKALTAMKRKKGGGIQS